MAVNTTEHKLNRTINTGRGPSPSIWASCPVVEMQENPGIGYYFYDDFRNWDNLTTPTITTQATLGNGYKAFGSSGGTILAAGIENGGGLTFTETDDNEGYNLATIQLPFKIIRGNGDFWFEARLKVGSITDNDFGFVLGLWEQQTLSATVPIAAAGTLADANFVGFHRLEADGDQIDGVYKSNGNTQASYTDILDTVNTVAGALVADTYIKLGMTFNRGNYAFNWYVNGVQYATTKTIPSAAGTDFPNDVQMGLCFAALGASNNDAISTLDWWRAGQLAA